jgi:hypothetical protein
MCILVPKVLSSNPSQVKKIIFKKIDIGRESYQQVDSEKIITTRYLEEIHSCKIGRKLRQQNASKIKSACWFEGL